MTLQLEAVVAGYGSVPVLHQVSVSVAENETLTILGPNGAGKSTLLKAIIGVLPVSSGGIWLDGQDITQARTSTRARLGIAWVPEGRRLFPSLSVRENLSIAARRVTSSVEHARMEEVFSPLPRPFEVP